MSLIVVADKEPSLKVGSFFHSPSVFSQNFSSAGKGPFLTGKAKNSVPEADSPARGGASHS